MYNEYGVKMQNTIVIDVNQDADEVCIPPWADDTKYRIPLYKIKCMTVFSLEMLGKFVGLPERLILNDTNDFNEHPMEYWNAKSPVNSILGRQGMKWIEVTEQNPYYKTIDGILYTKDGRTLLKCPTGRTGEVRIPEGVECVAEEAFMESHISSVIFPDSMEELKENAFSDCKQLSHIEFGHGIKYIGGEFERKVFSSCSSLEKIDIPKQVRAIGPQAFWHCSLKEVTFHDGLNRISSSAFLYCMKLNEVHLPDSLLYVGPGNFIYAHDVYINCIPDGIIDAITSLTMLEQPNSKENTVILHIQDEIVCIPRCIIPNKKEALLKILKNKDSQSYADTFNMTLLKDTQEDTALYTYLYGTPNKDVIDFLKSHGYQIAERMLMNKDYETCISLLKTGFIKNEDISSLLNITEDVEVRAYLLDALNGEEKTDDFKVD